MKQILTFIIGYLIVLGTSAFFIWSAIALYSSISKNEEKKINNPLSLLILAFFNLIVFFVSLAFLSFNIYFYVIASFLLSVAGYYFIMTKLFKNAWADSLILSIVLALILSPAWLRFLSLL